VKIDSSAIDLYKQATDRVGGPTPATGNPAAPVAQKTDALADRLQLSPEAQLLQNAIRSAQEAPEIRQDVVERLRAAMQKGEVGNDAGRLADAILDDWIGSR